MTTTRPIAAARAQAAVELKTAAWIRRQMANVPAASSYRRGMRDAHRDCIRTARYNREVAKLRAAE